MASTEPRLADGRSYPQFLAPQLDDALSGRTGRDGVAHMLTIVRGVLRALDPLDLDAYGGAYAAPLIDETHRRLERARFAAALPKLEKLLEANNGKAAL